MTYKPANLVLTGQPIAGARHWDYSDTGSTVTTVTAAEYFSDGADKGMVVGDQVCYRNLTATINYGLRVSASGDTGEPSAATVDGPVIIGDTS